MGTFGQVMAAAMAARMGRSRATVCEPQQGPVHAGPCPAHLLGSGFVTPYVLSVVPFCEAMYSPQCSPHIIPYKSDLTTCTTAMLHTHEPPGGRRSAQCFASRAPSKRVERSPARLPLPWPFSCSTVCMRTVTSVFYAISTIICRQGQQEGAACGSKRVLLAACEQRQWSGSGAHGCIRCVVRKLTLSAPYRRQ